MPPIMYTIKRGWLLGRGLAELMKRLNREEKMQCIIHKRGYMLQAGCTSFMLSWGIGNDLRLDFSFSVSP